MSYRPIGAPKGPDNATGPGWGPRGVAQLGRAPALGAGGRWFESSRPDTSPDRLPTRIAAPRVSDSSLVRMTQNSPSPRVRQLRLVVEADDFEAALHFYRDVLGLSEEAAFEGEGDARVAILDAGRATLELANPAQVRMIDAVEAEGRPSARLRVALEVDDSRAVTDELEAAGAEVVAAPRETPWHSLNSRLHAPAGLEITVFQKLENHRDRVLPAAAEGSDD